MKILQIIKNYGLIYLGSLGLIWGAIEMSSYFEENYLRNLLGKWWIGLYFIPLPFILFAAFREFIRQKPVAGWEALINNYVSDAKIYGAIEEQPRIEMLGAFPLTRTEAAEAAELRKHLEVNDQHGMVSDEPILEHSPILFRVRSLDYAALEVLRKRNKQQYILSANVIVVCRERKMLILHHRSANSRTYPNCLHTVGGSFQPVVGNRAGDFNLLRTARREIDEEIGAAILVEEVPPMILTLEPSNKFIQLVFLGANISAGQCDKLRSNWEGQGITKIHFDDLEMRLMKKSGAGEKTEIDWVPSGKAHVLAWLAHGAPGAGFNPAFGKLSPRALFNKIVSS